MFHFSWLSDYPPAEINQFSPIDRDPTYSNRQGEGNESEFVFEEFGLKFESVGIGKCQNLKESELVSARIRKCQNLKLYLDIFYSDTFLF